MDFTEFRRRLGAEPRSRDSDLLQARDSGPEFAAAAAAAEEFEAKLERALSVPEPQGLVESLCRLPVTRGKGRRRQWVSVALAAGLLLAIGAAGVNRLMHPHWDTVEDYVVDHYYHDGVKMLAQAPSSPTPEAMQTLFERFDVEAAPELRQIVGVIKICVTPDGKGIHMVLNTVSGPVTVLYMPATSVDDHERFTFDGQQVMLVGMERGSAAIISPESQDTGDLYAFVQASIRRSSRNS